MCLNLCMHLCMHACMHLIGKGQSASPSTTQIRTENGKNENYAPNFMQYMYITVL